MFWIYVNIILMGNKMVDELIMCLLMLIFIVYVLVIKLKKKNCWLIYKVDRFLKYLNWI